MTAGLLGLILAGGQGRRMGGVDKTLLPLGGQPLLARIAQRLRPQCPAGLVLSANGDPARFADIFEGPVLPDPVPGGAGPLAGLLAGLAHGASRPDVTHVLSVSGDVPFLPGDLAARLAASRGGSPIAVAASGGREHYTAALWPVDLRDDLRSWLAAGERRVGAFIARHGAAVVEWSAEPVDPFLNLNAPEDVARAEAADQAIRARQRG